MDERGSTGDGRRRGGRRRLRFERRVEKSQWAKVTGINETMAIEGRKLAGAGFAASAGANAVNRGEGS